MDVVQRSLTSKHSENSEEVYYSIASSEKSNSREGRTSPINVKSNVE